MASNATRSRGGTSKRKGAKGAKGGRGSRGKASKPQAAPRSKTGCYTCRIRRKKCDESVDDEGSCSTCRRLNVQCLGFGVRRPQFLKDQMVEIRQRIKEHLSRSSTSEQETLILCPDITPSSASIELQTPSPQTHLHQAFDEAGVYFMGSPYNAQGEPEDIDCDSSVEGRGDFLVHGLSNVSAFDLEDKGSASTPQMPASDPFVVDALQGLVPSENPDLVQITDGSGYEEGALFASQGSSNGLFDITPWVELSP
ncbi:hypothetical protein HDZ31DRAFT_62679 [Schizophyllum fasciatum]